MKHTVTVFRGDGIGPELVDNVLKILKAADAPLEYEIYNVGEDEEEKRCPDPGRGVYFLRAHKVL